MASDVVRPTIAIFGLGVLGGAVLDFLSQSGMPYDLVVCARDEDKAGLRINLSRYAAQNLGFLPAIRFQRADVMDVERTADLIDAVQPDIIFNATTLQSWWIITQLPPEAYQPIDAARGGVWTAMHLVLTRRLMKAVRLAGSDAIVVNASYPDVVNASLSAEGLAPAIGIGNIANAVPGLRLAAADLLHCEVGAIDVRFFAQHYVSYRMPSTGKTDGAPYHLTLYREGAVVPTETLSHDEVFRHVAGRFRRTKGLAGQAVTASSATAVLRALADGVDRVVHAPGPLGLVGGYPVRINTSGMTIDLPDGLSLDDAVALNAACQRFDGIEAVDSDGTIRFTKESTDVVRETLKYEMPPLKLSDCEEQAAELAARFDTYRCQVNAPVLEAA